MNENDPEKGWTIKVVNNDTGEEVPIELTRMNYRMDNDLMEFHNPLYAHPHRQRILLSKGYSLDLQGYCKNHDFQKEYDEAWAEIGGENNGK